MKHLFVPLIDKYSTYCMRHGCWESKDADVHQVESVQDYEYEHKLRLELQEALESLANEASGFLHMADPSNHGHTNMACLGRRIEEARAALEKASSK